MKLFTNSGILLVTLCFFILSTPAFAYLDPGTGSMIIQFLVAGILGGLYAIKTFWRQISAWLAPLFKKSNKA